MYTQSQLIALEICSKIALADLNASEPSLQVALIVIMAQIGCFVPAKAASLSCVNKLFTQFGTGDSVETNSSSFMLEMKVLSCTLHASEASMAPARS